MASSDAAPARSERVRFPGPGIDAVIFDLDGVVTDTASVHALAWKRVFDEYLRTHSEKTSDPFREFDIASDYARYVDGRPRYEGAASFFESRGIALPHGEPDDRPGTQSVTGIANLKDDLFRRVLEEDGVQAYETSVALIKALAENGVRTAVITASRNGRAVLESAGVLARFEVVIDGYDALEKNLPGKPFPDVFLEAARMMGVSPSRTAIVEDAQAGVEAGRRGGFRKVLGVDRLGQAERLLAGGADEVVGDLGEVELMAEPNATIAPMLSELHSALDAKEGIAWRMMQGSPVVFLDYDGTLSPIVDDPATAEMAPGVREELERLALAVPVAIISGRDLADIRQLAGAAGLHYAGSHGFEIVAPDGSPVGEEVLIEFRRFLPALDEAEERLRVELAELPGVFVERKRYAIAVHYRRADEGAALPAETAVDAALAAVPGLRKTTGKKVFELRPDVDWDKGKALLRLLDVPALGGPNPVPLFIGDDLTDEDAYQVLTDRGVSVVVEGEIDRPTIAEYALADPQEAGVLLGYLAETLGKEARR